MVGVFPVGDAETDKLRQDGNHLIAGNTGTTDNLVEGKRLFLQDFKNLFDGIGISHHGSFGILRLAPDGQMNRRCDDVLVGNADIGPLISLVVDGTDGAALRRRNGGYDYGAPLNMIGVELDAGLGATITVSSLVHHVDLFFGTYTRHVAVVANTYEQSPTVSICKSRY